MNSRFSAVAIAALMSPVAASAAELTVGVGIDDVLRPDRIGPVAGLVELRSDPLGALGPASLALVGAVEIDADLDVWAGFGALLRVETPLLGLRIEASFMPGLNLQGEDGDDLGADVIFRSQIGFSAPVAPGWRIGAALGHKSNAGLDAFNPGIETLFLTLSRAL